MRLAILSDVHANLEALQAVLAHVDAQGVDAIHCLGDVVGYGGDPVECVDIVRERCEVVVLGNHDLAVAREEDLDYLPKDGRAAAIAHRKMLSADQLDWLGSLPLIACVDTVTLVHATPHEPEAWHRLGGYAQAAHQFEHFETPVCFVGHTHIPGMMADAIGVFQMRPGRRYLVNVGSVGQPRDHDPRAAYCLFDTEAFSYEIVRVPYDVEKAGDRIVAAGIPTRLASRLRAGV